MRLIDADALVVQLADYQLAESPWWGANGYGSADKHEAITTCIDAVDEAPTIDAVEVVHGHWIVLQNRAVESICYWSDEQRKADKKGAATIEKCKCSNCGWITNFMGHIKTGVEKRFNYCPNCGAKMDEVTE